VKVMNTAEGAHISAFALVPPEADAE